MNKAGAQRVETFLQVRGNAVKAARGFTKSSAFGDPNIWDQASGATGVSRGGLMGAAGGAATGIPIGLLLALLSEEDEEGNKPWLRNALIGGGLGALGGGLLGHYAGEPALRDWADRSGLAGFFAGQDTRGVTDGPAPVADDGYGGAAAERQEIISNIPTGEAVKSQPTNEPKPDPTKQDTTPKVDLNKNPNPGPIDKKSSVDLVDAFLYNRKSARTAALTLVAG